MVGTPNYIDICTNFVLIHVNKLYAYVEYYA